MASGFIELSTLTGDDELADACLSMAERQLRTLSSDEYLVEEGECAGFILKHSTGNKPGKSEIDVPLSYADYYFLEALVRLNNLNK